jgi:beta-lactamase superfamily II metal-dependent hydrolase
MLRIEMLPASQGDCLWIEYGARSKPKRILIDGGTTGSIKPLVEKVKALPAGSRHLELLVVTHVDADHIAGVLKFLETPQLGLSVGEVWFNAYKHLLGKDETFGPAQGEKLSADIVAGKVPWNTKFKGRAVKVPDKGPLPVKKFDGGLELVVLGPTMQKLRILKPVWVQACKEAGIKPGKPAKRPRPAGLESFGPLNVDTLADAKFKEDPTEANGSSIILLLRYDGTTILLGADGHPAVIEAGLKRLVPGNGRLKLDAYKVAHHGSQNNVNRPLLDRINCSRYLFSSNGAIYHHPSREAIARVLKYGKSGNRPTELVFNYRTKFNDMWDAPALKQKWGYTTTFPASGQKGLVAFEKPWRGSSVPRAITRSGGRATGRPVGGRPRANEFTTRSRSPPHGCSTRPRMFRASDRRRWR